jgi:hypothetical protein
MDLAEVVPSNHYRFAPVAGKRNKGYLQRLTAAKEVFSGQQVGG